MYGRITSSSSNAYHCKNCGRTTYGYYITSSRSPGEFCSEGCARQFDKNLDAQQQEKKERNKAFKGKHPILYRIKVFSILALVLFIVGWVAYYYVAKNVDPFTSICKLIEIIATKLYTFINKLLKL